MSDFVRNVKMIAASGLFDREWYLGEYEDVRTLSIDPLEHYVRIGYRLNRDPSPRFNSRHYLDQNPAVANAGTNPLVHYLLHRMGEGRERFSVCSPPTADARVSSSRIASVLPRCTEDAVTVLPGNRLRHRAMPTVVICAHAAGRRLFGSERSLMDMVRAISAMELNVVVTLPKLNESYISQLSQAVHRFYVFDYGWWTKGTPPNRGTIDRFRDIFRAVDASAVHVNTIMLREPLSAAKELGLPSVVHVRELIHYDKYLAASIGEPPDEIARKVTNAADFVAANSEATATKFWKPGRTVVVPNMTDVDEFDVENAVDTCAIRFGMVSSNIPKKGVEDFVELARLCETVVENARFALVGPTTPIIEKLRAAISTGDAPKNLEVVGYKRSACDAVATANVVVNLSHFAESFGRTILEGMAARRPVIAYHHGALPELIEHGRNGFLVPYRRPDLAVEFVQRLAADRDLICRMGEEGRRIARTRFSAAVHQERISTLYDAVLKQSKKTRSTVRRGLSASRSLANKKRSVDVSVIVPNFNYAEYLPERLNSILNQTALPSEIVFLDDASADASVEVAEKILGQSEVHFTIIRNESNKGTYRQWIRGIAEAQCDLVWIAEADDTCEPNMLVTLVEAMRDERTVIAYCQSKRIDENSVVAVADNLHHTNEIDRERWRQDYRELGLREVVDYLIYRNTIPNVSACLLRRSAMGDVKRTLSQARFCGDRLLYAHMLRSGNVAYVAQALNGFRRHGTSVTKGRGSNIDLLEEVIEVRRYICENFPIHASRLSRADYFLDKDYKVEGVSKNTEYSPLKGTLNSIANRVAGNRRFAFITTNNGSFDGGSELWWRESAKRLREIGHDVTILIKRWDPPPPFLADFDRFGIKAYFKEDDGFQAIVDFAPDLVIVSVGDQDEGIEYYHKLRRNGIHYVIVNRLTKEERFWPIRASRHDKVREGYLGAEKVFFACQNNHHVMEKRLGRVLPKWDRIFTPCHADRNAVLPFPPLSGGLNLAVPAKILFVHKGQDLIVEVMKQTKWRRRDITINLYGKGRDEERLRQMVLDAGLDQKIIFHGKIVIIGREHEISLIWLENQAVLMPSRMEGFPNMVVNAMMSGRVPIVTDIGGHAEAIQDGLTGFIASDPSPEALDDAMERAYDRRHEWEEVGQNAKRAMVNYLPTDPTADAVEKIIEVVGIRGNADARM